MNDEADLVLGHRKRLKEKLLNSKRGTFPDYEILELILFLAKPRGDTKPLAKSLIKKFGSFGKVINADPILLEKENGVGESVISTFRIVQESAISLAKEELSEKTIIASWKALLDYCRVTMGHLKTEQFRILYLNKKNILIADELCEYGTVDQAIIYPREIIKKALFYEASSIILVHNHPSGCTKPSRSDIDLTKKIMQLTEMMGISLHDHVIISSDEYFSFRSNGLI